MRMLVIMVALLGLALAASGAVGAHVIDLEIAGAADRWDSALLYGFAHTGAALAVAALPLARMRLVAGWAFVIGVVLFSGLQIAGLIWGRGAASPLHAVSMLIPVGGASFMAGWIMLVLAALRTRSAKP